jgi:hypothetical protein
MRDLRVTLELDYQQVGNHCDRLLTPVSRHRSDQRPARTGRAKGGDS